MEPYTVESSETLLEAPIIAVRRDQVRMPGGNTAAREIVEHFGAVAVVALDDQGQVCLLTQWRQAPGRTMLELPAGLLDDPQEEPLPAIQRELVEEAGLQAEQWDVLVDMYTSPGFADEAVRIYLARQLTEVARPAAHDEEQDIELHWMPLSEAVALVHSGQLINAIAIAGVLAAASALEVSPATTQNPDGAKLRDAAEPFAIRPTALRARRLAKHDEE